MAGKIEQLEIIRTEAIRFLVKEKPTNWAVHVNELKRGGVMFIDGSYRIGRWVFDWTSLTMLREADIERDVRRYGLIFHKESDSVYRVIQDFWERERFDFND